tara:strand:+ start:31 stop:165 length:135 start_codon:yes stop_codon:yes gene_type:complete
MILNYILCQLFVFFLVGFILGFVTIYLTYDKKEDIGFIILNEKD